MRHVKDKETKCLYVVVIRAASETKDRVTYERFVEALEGKIGQYLEEARPSTIEAERIISSDWKSPGCDGPNRPSVCSSKRKEHKRREPT